MPRRTLRHYLHSARLAAGLSQAELGMLIGVSDDVISNCELERTNPTLVVVLGCALLFGRSAVELFPDLCHAIQDEIGRHAAEFDARIRDRTDAASRKKQALLKALSDRSIVFEV